MHRTSQNDCRTTLSTALAPVAAALTLLVSGAAHAGAPSADAGWTKIANPPPVVGADGAVHAARCSGLPGTDSSYSFWTRRGSSRNVVVYFEGGGGCWDSLTCSFPIAPNVPPQLPQFYVPAVPNTSPAQLDGLFRSDRADNPVRDWNIVYVPYCTADLHNGSADRVYANMNPMLPTPTLNIHHGGYDNFMVVLDWMQRNLNHPHKVLVAGSSAGGYGATLSFPWLARTWPHAQFNLIADASEGVTTRRWDSGPGGRQSWNPQLAPWVWGADAATTPSFDILPGLAAAYPHARIGQFTTQFDQVQIGFYGVMKQYYPPGGSCNSSLAVDWYQQMSGAVRSFSATLPNYRHYVAAGSYHTLLRDGRFYSEASGGLPFAQWLGHMLSNRGGTVGGDDQGPAQGQRWLDAACPGCLAEIPCP